MDRSVCGYLEACSGTRLQWQGGADSPHHASGRTMRFILPNRDNGLENAYANLRHVFSSKQVTQQTVRNAYRFSFHLIRSSSDDSRH